MEYQDKMLTCADCHQPFAFTAREQEFHASKGFTNEPKRCRNCRQARKSQRTPVVTEVARPRSENGKAPVIAPTVAESPRSFTSICNACGGEAVLSYEPTGNRAVLCAACYEKVRAFA